MATRDGNFEVSFNTAHSTQLCVARRAGVSRTTVAEVLAGKRLDRYNIKTRRKVFEAVRRLNYRPNRQARILRGAPSNCIGILSFDAMRSLAQRKVKEATEDILNHGYQWLVQETLWNQSLGGNAVMQAVNNFMDARVEGVVLIYPNEFTQDMLDMLLKADIPVVTIAGDHLKGIPNFISDRAWGYEQITRHLLDGGYRRLALLGSGNDSSKAGFCKALEAFPEAQSDIVFPITDPALYESLPPEERRYLPGVWGMQKLLERGTLPEAVVCGNDEWAIGALTVCSRAGLQVPRDLAMAGFDNDPAGRYGAVPLTTMDHPVQEISRQAVDCLVDMIRNNRKPEGKTVSIRGKLIVRDSCGLGADAKKTAS